MSFKKRREPDSSCTRSPRDRAAFRPLAPAAFVLALIVPALAQTVDLRPSGDDLYDSAPPARPGAGAPLPPAASTPMTATPLPGAYYPAPSASSTPSGMSPEAAAANYGKPRPFRPGPKKKKKSFAHPLPALAPYPTSAEARRLNRLGLRDDDVDPALLAPAPTAAMPAPIPPHRKPKPDPDPFAPIGFDAGPFRAHAYSETDFGYNSNPNQAAAGTTYLRGSSFVREEVGLSAVSDWSNHSFIGEMRLGYNDYFNASSANAPDGSGNFLARIDVARDTKINIDGNYTLSTQYQTSPNLYNNGASTQLSSRPLIAIYGGGLGVSQVFNRTELTLRGSFERNYWADAHFADGSTQYLSRDSYNDYGATLKASYALTPDVKPFISAGVDQRIHDTTFGSTGYDRNSVGATINVGSTFDITRLLAGSASVGYEDRNYQDPRLANLRGPIFDISLIWTPTPLTTVTLRALTTMDETTVYGASGVIARGPTIEIAHALRRDLTLTATGGVQYDTYPGNSLTQTYYTAGIKAEYHLTRSIVLKGAYLFQCMTSNQAGTDYTANILTVGLRLQQ